MTTLGSLIVLALFVGTASATSLGTVYTESGAVRGDNIFLGIGRRMDVFKGIPFADIPVRFEKPRRHPGWDGVMRAMDYKPRCMQLTMKQDDVRGTEDCLYLNIWVPHGRKVSTNLPVMIWIYGGGFLTGGSMGANFLDNYLYDGKELADRGDMIVVTLGYRVGTLGFLSTGDERIPGNYGLWDQQAAIAWVHRNIRTFGGNPNSISIFGESAGGASVNFQILTPYNKGIIKGAISQSGTAFCPWAVNRNPLELAEKVALQVNCPIDDTMVECLKLVDPWQLTLAAKMDIMAGSPSTPLVYDLVFAPVIDGDFLPDEPAKLFANAEDVDYIAGANNMDGHVFTMFDVSNLNNPFEETTVEDLKALIGAYTREKGSAAQDAAFNLYSSNWEPEPTWESVKRAVVDVGTDYIFMIPTQTALFMHAAHAKRGRTYSYLLSEPNRAGGVGKPYPTWMGADHMDDLQYVFGKPFSSPVGYWPSQRDLSEYFIAYWANFAKSGDPNQGGHRVPVIWPSFNRAAGEYLDLNGKMTSSNAVKQGLRLPFVEFWTSEFPNINSTSVYV